MTSEDGAWRSPAVLGWVAMLTALVLAPLVQPGYVLVGDMVATPSPSVVPDALGLGSGLPRSVPMDAVVALLASVVDGAVVQRVALAGGLVLAGLGAARLVRGGRTMAAGAATLMIWNPFVAERLLMGQWALLLAYGATPWAVAAAMELRQAGWRAGWSLLGWLALAGLTAPGAVAVLAVVLPVVVWPGDRSWTRRTMLVGLVAVVSNLPWIVPAVLHPSGGLSDAAGVEVFAARADTDLGLLGSLLGLGGIWNSAAVPASREAPTAAMATVVLVGACVAGYPALRRQWGRAADGLLAGAIAGLLAAMWGAVLPGSLEWAVETVPAAGLFRDGHRFVVAWGLLAACAAPMGAAAVVRRLRSREARNLVAGGMLVLPIVVLPDLASGVLGRVTPVEYPAGWETVRSELAASPDTADVISLPWQAFRRYPWNGDRAVLDPLPRFLDRVVVASGDLPIATEEGVTTVRSEDVRARRVGAIVAEGEPLGPRLLGDGIGWAVVQRDTPGDVELSLLDGAEPVLDTPSLLLFRLADEADLPAGTEWPRHTAAVVAIDVAVLTLVATGTVATSVRRWTAATVRLPRVRGRSG